MTECLLKTRLFLLDMDGTFYLGDRLIDGALDFIDTIQRQGRDFLFLTNNSSKHRGQYAEKITRLGLPIPDEKVFTSGEATALYLGKHYPGARIYLCGTPALEQEFTSHGFSLVQENPDLVVLGFDTTLTYAKLWKFCDFARSGLPYIATHRDINCPVEGGYMPDIGAMITCIAASTGRQPDLVVGKPNRIIIDSVVQKTGYPKEQMAMVGDRLYTDIALGRTSGVATVLVLSGETRRDELVDSEFQPDYIFPSLKELSTLLAKQKK